MRYGVWVVKTRYCKRWRQSLRSTNRRMRTQSTRSSPSLGSPTRRGPGPRRRGFPAPEWKLPKSCSSRGSSSLRERARKLRGRRPRARGTSPSDRTCEKTNHIASPSEFKWRATRTSRPSRCRPPSVRFQRSARSSPTHSKPPQKC